MSIANCNPLSQDKETRSHELLESAFTWQAEGVSVVPVQPHSKACFLPWKQYEDTLPDDQDLYHWFTSGVMNLAIVAGSGGVLVLDFDSLEEYQAWSARAGDLARTYTELTSRGVHLFYKVDKPETRNFEECESLGAGHLCNVWPSVHPSGWTYRPVDALAPLLETETEKLFSLLSERPSAQPLPVQQVRPQHESTRDLVSRIKARYSLAEYAQLLVHELKPSGRNSWYVGKCPLHEDSHPSFTINLEKGYWKCLSSSCVGSKGGDIINLYALTHGLSVQDAIRELARGL